MGEKEMKESELVDFFYNRLELIDATKSFQLNREIYVDCSKNVKELEYILTGISNMAKDNKSTISSDLFANLFLTYISMKKLMEKVDYEPARIQMAISREKLGYKEGDNIPSIFDMLRKYINQNRS